MTETANPLVDIPMDVPFDRIEARHVAEAIDLLLVRANEAVEAIVASKAPRTYDNTLAALERATEALSVGISVVGHMESVSTSPELREAYNQARPKVSAFYSSLPLNEGLYAALRQLEDVTRDKPLENPRARHLAKTMDTFRRNGAALDAAGKARLSEIDVALTKVSTRYAQNVLDATNAFELVVSDEADLAGLPESAKAAAKQSAQEKGADGWRFTLQAPSVIAALTYLDNASLREKLWRADNTKATSGELDNRALMIELLKLRREKALLLGFKDFADYVLHDRMAKNGGRAWEFVQDLHKRTKPAFDAERDALWAFRKELEGPDAPQLSPWDISYYAEKMRQARFAFEDEELRPYFSVEQVLRGLFAVAESIYGISVTERDAPKWHESVRTYGIHDSGKLIATFSVDLFPRESKRGGAWMHGLMSGASFGESTPHVGVFVANVSPPVGDQPALLRHREVETLFHEFGHLLHHALSEVPIPSLGGTNVAWDFVELPSQVMENFCWERSSLDLFAHHWETNAPIPDELLEKMQKARTFRAATAMMRQLGFATVDLRLHREVDPTSLDIESMMTFSREVLQAHYPAALPDNYAMICGFPHIFGDATGYAAGYYSYKWAEVLDADAFTRFKAAGVLSRDVGSEFRKAILSQGDSADPDELYIRFMGREPKLDALLERSGLATARQQG